MLFRCDDNKLMRRWRCGFHHALPFVGCGTICWRVIHECQCRVFGRFLDPLQFLQLDFGCFLHRDNEPPFELRVTCAIGWSATEMGVVEGRS